MAGTAEERKVLGDYVDAHESVGYEHLEGECRECDIRRAQARTAREVLAEFDTLDRPIGEWVLRAGDRIADVLASYSKERR